MFGISILPIFLRFGLIFLMNVFPDLYGFWSEYLHKGLGLWILHENDWSKLPLISV